MNTYREEQRERMADVRAHIKSNAHKYQPSCVPGTPEEVEAYYAATLTPEANAARIANNAKWAKERAEWMNA